MGHLELQPSRRGWKSTEGTEQVLASLTENPPQRVSAVWGKPGYKGLGVALPKLALLTCPNGRHGQGSCPQQEQLPKESHPRSVPSRDQTWAIAFGASGETGVQTLTAPGSEQGTRSKEAPQVSLTVFWSPPLRVSSFGSELCLRVAIEIWGPKLEKTRMSAHPLPDGNQDSDPAWLLGFEKGGRGSKLHEQLSS